ncbi:uncharacterized protein LOC132893260 isoform X2 [Neoarius graeffei]|uniref:uncharacterized protein LOC132893260 isoform X2 n=1 Tax=Neoarius graeffei TaxID=443677 RepID=UPI00298BF9FD|nr:uncharacterized protein LOC132893260 isoform X2 [Neoarius graeffei]
MCVALPACNWIFVSVRARSRLSTHFTEYYQPTASQNTKPATPLDSLRPSCLLGPRRLTDSLHLLHSSHVQAATHMESPAMTWRLVQGVPHLSPIVSWDRLQLACDPVQDKRIMDGWIIPLRGEKKNLYGTTDIPKSQQCRSTTTRSTVLLLPVCQPPPVCLLCLSAQIPWKTSDLLLAFV